MSATTYSIAEARNHFATLIRKVEHGESTVQVTRRGEPVAIILSIDEYKRLATQQSSPGLWQSYLEYQERWQNVPMDIEGDIWEGVRDKTTGREDNPWL